MTVPEVVGAIVAAQLDVVELTLASVQGVPENVPVADPVLVNATDPAGALGVPAAELSFTNAVQVVVCPTAIEFGVQLTMVVVLRRLTVTVLLGVGPLPR